MRDADQAEQGLLALGAIRVRGERETGFRVFADPVGDPSASFSVSTVQIEPAPAHAASRADAIVAERQAERAWLQPSWCPGAGVEGVSGRLGGGQPLLWCPPAGER